VRLAIKPAHAVDTNSRSSNGKPVFPVKLWMKPTQYTWRCSRTKSPLKTEHDAQCLQAFFAGCPRLREVTISFMAERGLKTNAISRAFRPAMTPCYGDRGWDMQRIRSVEALASAAKLSGQSLDSLTLHNVVPQVFSRLSTFDRERLAEQKFVRFDSRECQLRDLLKPLRRLRITLCAIHPGMKDVEVLNSLSEQLDHFEAGGFSALLRAANELRVL